MLTATFQLSPCSTRRFNGGGFDKHGLTRSRENSRKIFRRGKSFAAEKRHDCRARCCRAWRGTLFRVSPSGQISRERNSGEKWHRLQWRNSDSSARRVSRQRHPSRRADPMISIDRACVLFNAPLPTCERWQIVENVGRELGKERKKGRVRGTCQPRQPFKSNLTIKLLFTPATSWLILLITCLSRCPLLNRRAGKLRVTSA